MNQNEKKIRQSLKTNFDHYARKCLKIRTKDGEIAPLSLNSAQQYIHAKLEEQLRETGMIRAVILKGRQQGVSTYTEARFFWKTSHRPAVKTYVMSHMYKSTLAIFDMVKRFYEFCPTLVKPSINKFNGEQIVFDKLQSSFAVGTAKSGDAGRGETIQYLHGSEVAFWENEDEVVTGLLQAVPTSPNTEVILESTARGATGMFYNFCMRALKGEGDFQLIFVPWYWQTEYARKCPAGLVYSDEEQEYSKYVKEVCGYELSPEQIYWRRMKIYSELGTVTKFRQEYPANVEEAFRADVSGALWKRDMIKRSSTDTAIIRYVIGVDPATTAKKDSDETGIILAGIDADGKVHIIKDLSGKWSVDEWSSRVMELYHTYNVGKIVAETNQGGDMVIHALRTKDRHVNVYGKHVSVSKVARHEPVSALYTRGLVFHMGEFPSLEDQMVSWNPITHPKESPDRVDALTLAVGELLLSELAPEPFILDFD